MVVCWACLVAAVSTMVAASPTPAAASSSYLATLAADTYRSLLATVEPTTGLPNDKLDAATLDTFPQLAALRQQPVIALGSSASLTAGRCATTTCAHTGRYGLKLDYSVPQSTFASYNLDAHSFDAGAATQVELWAKGAAGGEAFEVVLWSDCAAGFPGRPPSAEIRVTAGWQRFTIPMADFAALVQPASLCRLSIGFNDAMHPGGTVYLDGVRFLDGGGQAVPLSLDEDTNVTTIGLYLASVLGARALGLETAGGALARLDRTLTSIEALPKVHGMPHAHNYVVSRTAALTDPCVSFVDLGNLAIGLVLVRQQVPQLAARAGSLLAQMGWEQLYDPAVGLPHGCLPGTYSGSPFHYDFLAADSRLAHLIAIGTGRMPASSWANLNRSQEPARCAGGPHFEPGWDGGGLFMLLLPALFLPDRGELRQSTSRFVTDQVCRSQRLKAPAWGWSATALPPEGVPYCGYGCVREDVLVPHASILAVDTAGPGPVEANLRALEALGARAPFSDGSTSFDFGFRSSLSWTNGQVTTSFLALDQAMSFLALVNHLTGGFLRGAACRDPIVRSGTARVPDYAVAAPRPATAPTKAASGTAPSCSGPQR